MKKYDVVALGELLIDFTENGQSTQGNPVLEANPGGAPCNVLAMLNRLDKKTAFIGKVGDDAFGQQLADALTEVGIRTQGLKKDTHVHTTLAFVHTQPDGDREFSFYRNPGADMMLEVSDLDEELLKNCKIFHFGSLSMTHEKCRAATRKAIEIAKKAGALVSFDPNLREPLWDSLEAAREQIMYGLGQCQILKISDNEIQWLTGEEDFDKGVLWIQKRFDIPLILVSKGKSGSSAYTKDLCVTQAARISKNTIETTGAGDTFCACVLNYVLENGWKTYSEAELKAMLKFANAAASVITTRKGALRVMPRRDEIPCFTAEEMYQRRFAKHHDELRWLYNELYRNDAMFEELCENMHRFYTERNEKLKESDELREENSHWYKRNDMLGMMFYIDNFAGNMKGVEKKLDYLSKCNVNYVHLMPFLDTPKGRSDGGYAVSDFRKVQPDLGTMDDLESLTAACHEKKINVCMDFVMNHTSEDHAWAKKARQGDPEYMNRYFFYKTGDIPAMYEKTVPQVFPTTAPGNFTWLEDAGHYVMTTFYPYQWDLNYANPVVFNEMMYNFLYLVNRGIDIIRIDAVPYIWKELGTQCRNLPKVHTIVRMMRMISEIVCPGTLLLGEVVMEPEKVVPYFGTVEKPECHMLYNVTTMATTWHTVATRNVGLLKKQLDIVNGLPKDYVFLNYLRCHDDIGWGLDYDTLKAEGMEERAHKKYLNDYFQGYTGGSNSRGELYNADPVTGDARFCATTASMCGIEKAGFEKDPAAMDKAIDMDVMLHAYMFMQSGIPVLYSGDEIGQVNDYTYKLDPDKAPDSRYIHRGAMDWALAARVDDKTAVQGRIFSRLDALERIRKSEKAFLTTADTWTLDTWDDGVLSIGRYYDGDKIIGVFNFTEFDKTAWINEDDGAYVDLISGREMKAVGVDVPAYGFYYLKKK